MGKTLGGFFVLLISCGILNLIFTVLCISHEMEAGFTVRMGDVFALAKASCLYVLPNMLMIVCVYTIVAVLFKNPFPAVPLLVLYIIYSNMGSTGPDGTYGYYGRPLAIMVRFPGRFFDTAPPPMAVWNQLFLLAASAALLTIVFCADTYLMEVQGKRREVFRLYALKKQIKVIYRRMIVQILYLFGIFTVGYGLFYWQRPIEGPAGSSLEFFVSFLWAIGGTILFWGILSVAVSILVGKQWLGIGVTAVLWFLLFSKAADEFLGKWNVFSYTFRNINTGDAGWIWGKAISVFLALLLAALLPLLLKKKG